MILALVFVPCAQCEQTSERLYDELGNYLHFADRIYEDQLWVISYAEKFLETREFEDLLKARAAAQAAIRELSGMQAPVTVLMDDEYMAYVDRKLEMEAVDIAYENAAQQRDDAIVMLINIFEALMSDVYFEPLLELFQQELALERKLIEASARDEVYFSAYMLSQLGNGEDFWNYMRENLVVISRMMPESIGTEAENLDRADENMLLIEGWVDELEVLSGYDDYWILMMQESLETGDFSKFKSEATVIANQAPVMPLDVWMNAYDSEYLYLYSDGEEKLYMYPAGAQITNVPDTVKITAYDVTVDEIVGYVEMLADTDCSPVYEIAEKDGVQHLYVLAQKDGAKLMIIWNAAVTDVFLTSPLVDLVPSLYIF